MRSLPAVRAPGEPKPSRALVATDGRDQDDAGMGLRKEPLLQEFTTRWLGQLRTTASARYRYPCCRSQTFPLGDGCYAAGSGPNDAHLLAQYDVAFRPYGRGFHFMLEQCIMNADLHVTWS